MFRRSFLIGSAGSILIAIALAACDSETPTATKPPVDGRVGAEPLAAANPKASSYEIVSSVSDIGSGFMGIMEAVGGGFFIDGNPLSGPDVAVYESSPRVTSVLGGTGWRLAAVNRTADQLRYEVFAICAAI
jgi:hypothetical protein